jgi:hypothetical protein
VNLLQRIERLEARRNKETARTTDKFMSVCGYITLEELAAGNEYTSRRRRPPEPSAQEHPPDEADNDGD